MAPPTETAPTETAPIGTVPTETAPDADTAAREAALSRVYAADGDTAKLSSAYDDWAGRYDRDLSAFSYLNPALVAGFVGRYGPAFDAPILDAGAGTGLIGWVLATMGFRDITGIDLSEGMLARAAKRNAYRTLKQQVLGAPLDFPDDAFAATTCVGTLTVGHAPPSALDELIRVTRPGGPLIFTITDGAYDAGGFGRKLDALTAAGAWRPVYVTEPYISLPDAPAADRHPGRVFVYQAA